MTKSVLFGNGVNIAFSGNADYCNYKIIERLLQVLETDKFREVFLNSVEPSEIKVVIIGLNEQFKEMLRGITAFKWASDAEDMKVLLEIITRYKGKSPDVLEVGMEDYFYVMKWFNNKFGADTLPEHTIFDALKYIFLDAIYNEGRIETLHTGMDCLRKELEGYENIFTINYDTNLDKLTDKPVYHLHGSFDVLDDTYREETINGYIAKQKPKPPTYIKGLEHLYCNAIMGYSGAYKKGIMDIYSNGNIGLSQMITRYNNPLDIEFHTRFQELSTSTDEKEMYAYKSVMAKLAHPELSHTEYPFSKFEGVVGDLHIIGMSPNNDVHIFNAINNNPSIRKVIYYAASPEDTDAVQKVINKPKEIRNVYKYWKSINK